MKKMWVSIVLGLIVATTAVGGGYAITKAQESKLEATGAGTEWAYSIIHNEALCNAQASLDEENKKADDEKIVDTEETTDETKEEAKVEETDKKESDQTSSDKTPSDKKEETVATSTNATTETTSASTETATQQTTEVPAEAPAQQTETQQVIAPEDLPADALVQTDAKEATHVMDFSNPLGTFDNPQSDSERLFNEIVGSATTAEEFTAAQQEYANLIFDSEGNVVDPSTLIYEDPVDTVTEEPVVTE